MIDLQLLTNMDNLITDLNSNNSSLNKIKILKEINDKHIINLLYLVYNSLKIFNITSKNILKHYNNFNGKNKYSLFNLLDDLHNRKITGNCAIEKCVVYIKEYTNFKDIILNILNKDLKIGLNIKSLNKAFNNLIPEFSVALAEKYEEKLIINPDEWVISRKLDGVRCITIIENGIVSFYSRQGKLFLTLGKIEQELMKYDLKNIILDGEITITDENDLESFNDIIKLIRKKDYTIENVKYFVFDVLTIEEFFNKTSSVIFTDRLKRYSIKKNNIINLLEQKKYNKLNYMIEQSLNNNWEGLMFRKDDIYKGKRSKDILKYKNFETEEFKVVSINTGKMELLNELTGKMEEQNILSAVNIIYKNNIVKVGSGFNSKERLEYYKNPNKIINKIISVQYFGESQDSKTKEFSLRFPTYKGIYGASRTF